jgi:hypothetical protein
MFKLYNDNEFPKDSIDNCDNNIFGYDDFHINHIIQ